MKGYRQSFGTANICASSGTESGFQSCYTSVESPARLIPVLVTQAPKFRRFIDYSSLR